LPINTDLELVTGGNILSPEEKEVSGSEIVLSASINFDYKTPFNIVLPSAAQNATPV